MKRKGGSPHGETKLQERLNIALADTSLTYAQLGELVGVHENSIGLYATGKADPSASTVARLAMALETSADWLLGLTDEEDGWR